jgi:hypothetical protein
MKERVPGSTIRKNIESWLSLKAITVPMQISSIFQ